MNQHDNKGKPFTAEEIIKLGTACPDAGIIACFEPDLCRHLALACQIIVERREQDPHDYWERAATAAANLNAEAAFACLKQFYADNDAPDHQEEKAE